MFQWFWRWCLPGSEGLQVHNGAKVMTNFCLPFQKFQSNHQSSAFRVLTLDETASLAYKSKALKKVSESRHISCEFLQKAWYYWRYRLKGHKLHNMSTVYCICKLEKINIYIYLHVQQKPTHLPPPYAIVIHLTLSPIHLCKNFTCCSPSYVEALSTTTLWLLIGVVEDKPQQSRFWTQSFVRFSE